MKIFIDILENSKKKKQILFTLDNPSSIVAGDTKSVEIFKFNSEISLIKIKYRQYII